MKVTPEVAQALVNLRGSSDFQTLVQGLEEIVEKDRDTCAAADGLLLYRAQGSVKSLSGILKAYADAPTILNKFKSR